MGMNTVHQAHGVDTTEVQTRQGAELPLSPCVSETQGCDALGATLRERQRIDIVARRSPEALRPGSTRVWESPQQSLGQQGQSSHPPSQMTNSATRECADTHEHAGTHPKCSSRSSVSIAVEGTSSISGSTDPLAGDVTNLGCAVRQRGEERGREASVHKGYNLGGSGLSTWHG